MKISKALTYGDIGEEFNKRHNGRKAQTYALDDITKWASREKDIFYHDKKEDTFHLILKNNEQVEENKHIKELIKTINADIMALKYSNDTEVLKGAGLGPREAENLALQHLKITIILLLNEVENMIKTNEKGDEEE